MLDQVIYSPSKRPFTVEDKGRSCLVESGVNVAVLRAHMTDTSLAPHPSPQIITRRFAGDARVPNHPTLPLVIYRGALPAERSDLADAIEQLYRVNGWSGAWRWSVYDFTHYHACAHEALAVFHGTARVRFGGEGGEEFEVTAGDVIIIPAGVGHRLVSESGGFQVVGAYPPGQTPDLLRDDARASEPVLEKIKQVPLPLCDPIYGADGPLIRLWRRGH